MKKTVGAGLALIAALTFSACSSTATPTFESKTFDGDYPSTVGKYKYIQAGGDAYLDQDTSTVISLILYPKTAAVSADDFKDKVTDGAITCGSKDDFSECLVVLANGKLTVLSSSADVETLETFTKEFWAAIPSS